MEGLARLVYKKLGHRSQTVKTPPITAHGYQRDSVAIFVSSALTLPASVLSLRALERIRVDSALIWAVSAISLRISALSRVSIIYVEFLLANLPPLISLEIKDLSSHKKSFEMQALISQPFDS
jgi:hypothetical protein